MWHPFSLPQVWPFGWWIGVIMDHYSRRIMGITLFQRELTSEAIRAFLVSIHDLARRLMAVPAGPHSIVTVNFV